MNFDKKKSINYTTQSDNKSLICKECRYICVNSKEALEHTAETKHIRFSIKLTATELLVKQLKALKSLNPDDHKPMMCKDCSYICANRAESLEHTENTGHTNFVIRKLSSENKNKSLICKECSYICANSAESLEHTAKTGHTIFKVKLTDSELLISKMKALKSLELNDHCQMVCIDCNYICANRAESLEHTDIKSHTRFKSKIKYNNYKTRICIECGFICANHVEALEHRICTGHKKLKYKIKPLNFSDYEMI